MFAPSGIRNRQIYHDRRKPKITQYQVLAEVGKGNMLADEDLQDEENENYKTSVKCVSKHGSLMMIKKEDYIRLLSGQSNAWHFLEEKMSLKNETYLKQ